MKALAALRPMGMLQANTQSGLDRILQYGFLLRAVVAIVALALLGWAIVSSWDTAMGNVLFAIFVTSAGVIALLVLVVLASNAIRS